MRRQISRANVDNLSCQTLSGWTDTRPRSQRGSYVQILCLTFRRFIISRVDMVQLTTQINFQSQCEYVSSSQLLASSVWDCCFLIACLIALRTSLDIYKSHIIRSILHSCAQRFDPGFSKRKTCTLPAVAQANQNSRIKFVHMLSSMPANSGRPTSSKTDTRRNSLTPNQLSETRWWNLMTYYSDLANSNCYILIILPFSSKPLAPFA